MDYVMIDRERAMKKLGGLIGFILGCAVLIAAFGIGWANWGTLANQEVVMQTLMGAVVTVALFLLVLALLSKGKDRWRTLAQAGALLVGLSTLLLFSVGWVAVPFTLFVLLLSLLKWKIGKAEYVTR